MKIDLIPEPELEFGSGKHVDIRFGLKNFGPVSRQDPVGPHEIRVGIVGTPSSIEGVKVWVESCREGVDAKRSKKPNFFPAFPGFGKSSSFNCEFIFSAKLEAAVSLREIETIIGSNPPAQGTPKLVDLFLEACAHLCEKAAVDVLVCAPPPELFAYTDSNSPVVETVGSSHRYEHGSLVDFHDLLKARGLRLPRPIQVIRPETYEGSEKGPQGAMIRRSLQDPATRAWNFHTALYYKAGGSLWRLARSSSDHKSCYVGVSFFRSRDQESVHTSVAQIFNERGEGMILRGGQPKMSDVDRQVHLSQEDMGNLINALLNSFYKEHSHLPARVVVHKTSSFDDAEKRGCNEALSNLRIASRDLLVIGESEVRLFRDGQYPPLRGTFINFDARSSVLYTRGSVDFFQMYPGMYVPRALEIRSVEVDQAPRTLAQEILALTKMNWNNTQFDSALPITVSAAKHVSRILRYVEPETPVHASYAYFM